jgi:hypothetical protein
VIAILAVLGMVFAATASFAPSDASTAASELTQLQQYWNGQFSVYPTLDPTLQKTLLAKAQPDECFDGIGPPYSTNVPPNCVSGEIPKVNDAYVWGLAKTGKTLWFGTAPNVECLVIGGYLGMTGGFETDNGDWVCEFGSSKLAQPKPAGLGLPAEIGDFRPPHIYSYDMTTKTLVEKTLTGPAGMLLSSTMGLRSAGTVDGVVFLAGPGLLGGVNMFAFNASTGNLISATSFAGYTNIRKWTVIDGVLYTGVGNQDGTGSILRWKGTVASPFQFDVVGNIGSEVAELAKHEGRLFVTTWPGKLPAGLWMSPTIPTGGLTTAQAAGWSSQWFASDYDPDVLTAMTYGGGALVSYDGYLYWGTMHVPFMAAEIHASFFKGVGSQQALLELLLGTNRAISIFRGRNFGTAPEKQVVYGQANLPVETAKDQWEIQPTKMGAPIWGLSGFGNLFNNYTWTMDVYDGHLFIGTMDWSKLLIDALPMILGILGSDSASAAASPQLAAPTVADLGLSLPAWSQGADLFRIDSSSKAGHFESVDGVGNYANYGIRTMLSDPDGFFLGTANPMNLMTNLGDDKPEGGWELLRMRPDYKLSLAPLTSVDPVKSSHTVTATLTPAKAGVKVHFGVTGANSTASGDATTDAAGKASWTYTGNVAGLDTIKASADVMGYGWDEDIVKAVPVLEYWLEPYATINGNAKVGKDPTTFSGLVGTLGPSGPVLGAIEVNYGHGMSCVLTPDGGTFTISSPGVATLAGWHSQGTGGCPTGSATVTLTATGPSFPKDRGHVTIDYAPTGPSTGDISLDMTGGKVAVVSP